MDIKDTISQAVQATAAAIDLAHDDEALGALMDHPSYQRDAEAIIRQAMDEGLDVLQLPNGDIVTTGTKIIVTTYRWDAAKQSLAKQRAAAEKPRKRSALRNGTK